MLNLAGMRKKAGMSQSEVAAAMGMSANGYGNWEREERDISLADACRLADVYHCTLDELAGRAAPSMTAEEREVMEALRATNGQGREAIVAVARSMKSAPSEPSAREVREAV